MALMTYAAAMVEAIATRMHSDSKMGLIGSAYLFGPAGDHPVLNSIREQYAHRIIDEPPISESAVAAVAIGSAMAGVPVLAHFGFASFALEAWSQLVHEAGVAHHQSGGQVTVPAVFTMNHGMSPKENSQHNRSPYAMLANCPGIEIVLPSTPADIKGLLTTALASNNPTVVVNHLSLMMMEGEVPDAKYSIPFGQADIKRRGDDVTIVATSHTVHVALEAAREMERDGIQAEVIDPRTIVPLDRGAIRRSVAKTGRLVVVDESPITCGLGAEIAALIAESAPRDLKAPVVRVSPPDVPIPSGTIAQTPFRITPEKVVAAAATTMTVQ